MTVSELLSKISSQEITEWIAYFKLENEMIKRREMDARAKAGLQKAKRMGK